MARGNLSIEKKSVENFSRTRRPRDFSWEVLNNDCQLLVDGVDKSEEE